MNRCSIADEASYRSRRETSSRDSLDESSWVSLIFSPDLAEDELPEPVITDTPRNLLATRACSLVIIAKRHQGVVNHAARPVPGWHLFVVNRRAQRALFFASPTAGAWRPGSNDGTSSVVFLLSPRTLSLLSYSIHAFQSESLISFPLQADQRERDDTRAAMTMVVCREHAVRGVGRHRRNHPSLTFVFPFFRAVKQQKGPDHEIGGSCRSATGRFKQEGN